MAELYDRLRALRAKAAAEKAAAASRPAESRGSTGQGPEAADGAEAGRAEAGRAALPAGAAAPALGNGNRVGSAPAVGNGPDGWAATGEQAWRRRLELPLPRDWWDFCLGGLDASAAAALRERLAGCYCVDCETTGLSGGSGTVAFLVGWCRVEGERVEIVQHFLQDYGGEAALVGAVADGLAGAASLASYNGASFDLPLLRGRFALNGREFPRLPHYDCLHPSRRLWRRLLDGCSLDRIERSVLGCGRSGDVDGALIPERYFAYLRSGAGSDFPQALGDVLAHHAADVHSLAMLLALLWAIESRPVSPRWRHGAALPPRPPGSAGPEGVAAPQPPDGALAVDARGLLRHCDAAQARRLVEERWLAEGTAEWGMLGAWLDRRAGRHAEAARRWLELWRGSGHRPALLAWLKWAEHKSGGAAWAEALGYIEAELGAPPDESGAGWREDLERRLGRISGRLARRSRV